MQDLLHSILQTLNSVPSEAWSSLVEILIGALTVSPLAQAIKKWFNGNGDKALGEKRMLAIVMTGSFAAAAISYIVTVPEFAPWVITIQGALTFAMTQPVYIYLVKPLSKRLGTWFTEQVAKASAITEAKAAKVPAAGLPIANTSMPIEDFSH